MLNKNVDPVSSFKQKLACVNEKQTQMKSRDLL